MHTDEETSEAVSLRLTFTTARHRGGLLRLNHSCPDVYVRPLLSAWSMGQTSRWLAAGRRNQPGESAGSTTQLNQMWKEMQCFKCAAGLCVTDVIEMWLMCTITGVDTNNMHNNKLKQKMRCTVAPSTVQSMTILVNREHVDQPSRRLQREFIAVTTNSSFWRSTPFNLLL